MSGDFRELRLEHLSREFGGFQALRDVSLTVKRGEFVALLGPSGCGKSTTLNCIAGLLAATGGSIWLDDMRIDTLRPEQRGFGMVFQNYALFPHLDIAHNVGFGLKMRKIAKSEIQSRVERALALVRLTGQEHKLPGQLSGGQQQRVAIARAIVIAPPLILMDEPLSNLDAKLRLEMRAEIRRIHAESGAATIYVTHDQEEALSLADRIVVMAEGSVRQIGTPQELFSSPAHPDIAAFMGFRNALAGRVTGFENGIATVAIGNAQVRGRSNTKLQAGEACIFAVRPENLGVVEAGISAIPVRVRAMEYRGDAWFGLGESTDGEELAFHSGKSLQPGDLAHLSTEPAHALVFGGNAT